MVKSIIMVVIIIVLLIIVIRYIAKDVSTLTGLVNGQTMQKIEATSLDQNNSSNFTYSIWFFINDWNYRYGEPKVIFGRGVNPSTPCPFVTLGPVQNNIIVSMDVYPGLDDVTDTAKPAGTTHQCSVANVPIQKWCNLFISVYGRTLDVYLDGKLVRTSVMPGVPKIDANAPIYVTPAGGFSGWTSRFQYWAESSDPQKAWNTYRAGYGGSLLGSLFGKYTIKLSLMEGDVEDASVAI